jgi:aldehyde dehydrogenase
VALLDESSIREIVADVVGRLAPAQLSTSRPDGARAPAVRTGGTRGTFGVFEDVGDACVAAHESFRKLQNLGVDARRKIVAIVKDVVTRNAETWGRVELEETNIGRLDHKIEKLQIIKLVPGVEWLRPYALSGDHGITHEEYTPFGVVAAVTPSTHSIPTLSGNIVNIVAAGNAVVFNAHPAAARCAALAVRAYNEAIWREVGIENIACIIEHPTLETFDALCRHEHVKLLLVTGGPGVVKAAMQIGKRAICAGPGNPPVVVDDTPSMQRTAQRLIQGAAYDNNLLCIGEKQVFALDAIADSLMTELAGNGAARLTPSQLDALTKAAFAITPATGGGCAHASVKKDLIGKDAAVLARAAGAAVPAATQLLFAETDADHPFVMEEQMMPFLPIVRVRTFEEGVERAYTSELGYKHTSMIHSTNVEHMTEMARRLDTTLFIKNGPCMAGLGLGGEGYLSYSIATPTGEGVTNPRTFCRVRRCVMVDNLRIY